MTTPDRFGIKGVVEAALALKIAVRDRGPNAPTYYPSELVDNLCEAAEALDLEAAVQINGNLVRHTTYKMGLTDETPDSLCFSDLLDLAAAWLAVRACDASDHARARPGEGKTFHTVMADRAVASAFVAHTHVPSPLHDPDPICVTPIAGGGEVAVLVVKTRSR